LNSDLCYHKMFGEVISWILDIYINANRRLL